MKRQLMPVLAFVWLWIFVAAVSVYALDPLYDRNGLVYLLVSDDNHVQDSLDGVYQVNRIPVPSKLFYPGLTYGLGVDLQLWLYTFSELKDNNFTAYTGPQEKVVNYKQASGFYTGAAWWHRCINQLNGSSRIGGSVGHFPCESSLHAPLNWSILANSVDGDPGLKLLRIPAGQWYHCRDLAAIGWPASAQGGWYATSETLAHPYMAPNPNFSTAQSWKMYRDVESRLYHKYHKHTWKPGDPPTQPPAGPQVAESYDVNIVRSIRNGCFDGCGIAVSSVALPSVVWHTSQVYNRWAKSYFYAREVGPVAPNPAYLDIDGVRHNTYPTAIGYLNDTSSEDVGVSMQNSTGDYVYILGKKLAQEWLALYYGAPITINYGKGVVSDQWWMTGGTVFVYDKSVGVIYQIERDETKIAPADKIKKVVVHSGVGNDVNDVGTDGFGNVFYTKTQSIPASPSDFTYAMRSSVTWGAPSGAIRPGTVKYRQNLYKTVFKKDIFGSQTSEGMLHIGYRDYDQNIQYTPWAALSDLTDTSFWNSLAAPYLVYSSIGNASRTEMAVVNVATPPNVSGEKIAKLDIAGPFGDSGSGVFTAPINPNILIPNVTYKFEVENFPLHNGKINQRTLTDATVVPEFRRIDRHPYNGFTGGFVSTLKILGSDQSECVKYHWKVFQVVDAASQTVLPGPKLIYERGSSSDYYAPYIFTSLDYGEYEIQVAAKYQWYDMDLLLYGSTVASLPGVLKPGAGAFEDGKAIDGTNWAKLYVKVSGTALTPLSQGNVVISRKTSPTTWVPSDATGSPAIGSFFVTTDLAAEEWKVEDPLATQLVAAMRKEFPPNPGDVHLRPGTLKWTDDKVEVSWSAKILNPIIPFQNGVYYSPAGLPFIGKTKMQTLAAFPVNVTNSFTMKTGPSANDTLADEWQSTFGIPSDPSLYELRCSAKRNYVWERNTYTYQTVAGVLVAIPGIPEPVSRVASITGIAKVLVLDRTEPIASEAVVTPKYLYAENNGAISGTVEGVVVNPNDVILEIPDGNPMAYLNWKRTEVPPAFGPVHVATNSLALFYYESSGVSNQAIGTQSLVVPTANLTILASGARSIYRVQVSRASLSATMPIHRAIHLINPALAGTTFSSTDVAFQPLGFGLTSLRDSSSNQKLFTAGLGETHLIDVIRPNAIIGIGDEKYSITRWIPNSSDFGLFAGYAWAGNVATWTSGANLGAVNVNGNIVSPLMVQYMTGLQPIEVDTPITFTLFGRDNITAASAVTPSAFQLQKMLPGSAGLEDISPPSTATPTWIHRRIFRMDTSGASETWVISGTVKDRALGMPSQPQLPYGAATTYPLRERARSIENIPFDVRNTTLDVRIIEKNNR